MFRCLSDLRIDGQFVRAGEIFSCPNHLSLQLLESGTIESIAKEEIFDAQEFVEVKKKKSKKDK